MSDEEEIKFIKNSSNMINSDSMSALNENASTYMGVKTIPEGTIPDKNEDNKNKKNKKKKLKSKNIKTKKNYKKSKKYKRNKNKDNSISSYLSSSSYTYSPSSSSSSSYSSSSSDSEILIEKKRKTHQIKKKKMLNEKEKENDKISNKAKNNKIKNIKTEEKSKNSGKKEEKIEKILKIEKKLENKENEIETKFEWDEGGNIVYLTGSFCDWKDFFLMKKNDEGKYTVTLPLKRGFHQYKFKIDDIWTYSKKQPKFEDNGNVNNFIDTTDYENLNEDKKEDEKFNESNNNEEEISQKERSKEKIIEKKKEKSKNKEKEKNQDKKIKNKSHIKENKTNNNNKITKQKRNSSTHNIHFLNEQNKYSIYYPLRTEFSKKPLALPGLYKTYYILSDKKNKKIKERKFSQIEYVDNTNNSIYNKEPENKSKNQSLNNSLYFINDINPYVNFQNLYHIHFNHLHSKEAINFNTTVTSIISRYRFKFSTFIYYKENQSTKKLDKKKHSKTVRIKRGKNSKISNATE